MNWYTELIPAIAAVLSAVAAYLARKASVRGSEIVHAVNGVADKGLPTLSHMVGEMYIAHTNKLDHLERMQGILSDLQESCLADNHEMSQRVERIERKVDDLHRSCPNISKCEGG